MISVKFTQRICFESKMCVGINESRRHIGPASIPNGFTFCRKALPHFGNFSVKDPNIIEPLCHMGTEYMSIFDQHCCSSFIEFSFSIAQKSQIHGNPWPDRQIKQQPKNQHDRHG